MHTEETVEYFKRIIFREHVFPRLQEMFSGLDNLSGRQGGSGGLFSLSIEVHVSRSLRPSRPIHGPETADMKIVSFLCCGKKMKVSEGWNSLEGCPFCGAGVVLV
jgi:hypothetical protein